MNPDSRTLPVALTIAGSDSGGGAGLQADIKAMQACGVFAASVVTAITAQNTRAVTAVHEVPEAVVTAQIDAVADDFDIAAVKTGMLASEPLIAAVAAGIERHGLGPLVVDPVMVTTSGDPLLEAGAEGALVERLFPLATLVTPNTHEAERLTGITVTSLESAERAARALQERGANAVLVKGGHLAGGEAIDVLLDGDGMAHFRAERIDTVHTHGTGCTYASAIAAHLALGFGLRESVSQAKAYVTEAIRHGLGIGGGHGPTDHFWFLRPGAVRGRSGSRS